MKYILTLILITLMPFMRKVAVEQEIPNDGLVAYYSFNHCDARDDTGNGSDGQMYGNVDCWCGVEGNGLLLDGKQSYIEFEGIVNDYFNTTDFTISFYFKSTSKSIFKESMLSKRDTCNENNMLDIQLNRQLEIVDTDIHETSFKDYRYLSPILDGPGWYHFALVRRGIHAYSYINGDLRLESRRCSGVDITNPALLSFSNSICIESGGVRRFKGVLDELRIYDHALSHDEVKALYSKYPVEYAEVDCVTFVPDVPEKSPQDLLNKGESYYICSTN